MIKATVVADSKNEFGNRITTMIVTFPRIILAELNTHRMLSKNSASSRAIPFEKMLKSVEENPFIPIAWQKDHKGMQGIEYLTDHDAEVSKTMWLEAKDAAVDSAKQLSDNGLTKQLCNRILEPFMYHTVIITATEWENFFALRCPKYEGFEMENPKYFRSQKDCIKNYDGFYADCTDLGWLNRNKGQAEIHMMALAEAMWDAYNESNPKELKAGEWHIPFVDNIDVEKENFFIGCDYDNETKQLIKISTARCARVSYTVVGEEGKEPNYVNDIKLYERLLASGHMSPFEHCAQAMSEADMDFCPEDPKNTYSGNFRGFIQYRKTLNNENITK